MTGSSIFDYVHQSDHNELAEQLGVSLAHQTKSVATDNRVPQDAFQKQSPFLGSPPAIPDGNLCFIIN